jgi:hypothetical protein
MHRITRPIAGLLGLCTLALATACSETTTVVADVETVELSPPLGTLTLGSSVQLSATPKHQGRTLTNRSTSWSSSHPNVASVDGNGLVRALGVGTAAITASIEGVNGTQQVSVVHPQPVLESITPDSVNAGSGAFTLTVRGSGFVPSSVVRWNGANRTTSFVSASELRASILAADIAAAGTAQITVFTPTPGGGSSSPKALRIAAVACAEIPITLPYNASGTLTTQSCRFESGHYVRLYRFTLASATTVTMTMRSTAVDSYLILYDNAYQLVAEDDDSGGGNDARISRALPAGVYNLAATTFAAGETGAYTLSVSAAQQQQAPTITQQSESVRGDTLRMHYTINPNGLNTTFRAEVGTSPDPNGFQRGPESAQPAADGTQQWTTTWPGRQPNTTYYYRIVAWNAAGTTQSPVRSFTMPSSSTSPSAPPSAFAPANEPASAPDGKPRAGPAPVRRGSLGTVPR